ncbi:hypothetical protein HD554DRAFT_2107201, partial [Boletus coccyginus]
MSTTQPPVVISSTLPSPSTTPTAEAPTLLFGFLVSTLSFFTVFMTLAIVWNRLAVRRHAIDAMLAMSPSLESWGPRQPIMWDIWTMPDKQPSPWLDIKPVAAQRFDFPSSSSRTMQTEQTIPFWRRHLLNRLPPEITYLFHQPVPPVPPASSDTDISLAELSHRSDIQVSLLIVMPHAHAPSSTQEGKHEYHEVVFATTNVPYDDPAS